MNCEAEISTLRSSGPDVRVDTTIAATTTAGPPDWQPPWLSFTPISPRYCQSPRLLPLRPSTPLCRSSLAMSLSQLALDHTDALTLVLTFLAPCDLSTCAALDHCTYRIVNSPTQRDSYLWRTITARLLQQHHRLPFIPPSPFTLSPYLHSSLSYFHVLSFTTVWPAGFTTLSLVTAPGHMHEIAVERDWTWEEVQHEHNKLVRAVADSRGKRGDREGGEEKVADREEKSRNSAAAGEDSEEDDVEMEDDDEEAWQEDDEDDDFDDGEGEDEEQEEEEGEDDEGEDEDDEERAEEGEEEQPADGAAQQGEAGEQPEQADANRAVWIGPREVYRMLDMLDDVTRNLPARAPPRAEGEQQAEGEAEPLMRDRAEFHRFFGRAFRVRGTEAQVAAAAEEFMAHRRRAAEERKRKQERKKREEERRAQMMRRAFIDVGTLMDADDDISQQARRRQQRKVEKQEQRWRGSVDAAIARGPAPPYTSSDDDKDEADDEKKHPTPSPSSRTERLATRLRYSNNTHGDNRAVVLDRPFPVRLGNHAVPFTVVEVVTRERLKAMQRQIEREAEVWKTMQEQYHDTQQEAASDETGGSGVEQKHDDETSRKRKYEEASEVEEKKQKVEHTDSPPSLLPLTRTRSLSSLTSPYYTLCRLSYIAYFEVHIEEADAEEVNRRELRQKEERERRKKERQAAREQRLAAGEHVDEDEEEAEEQQAAHRFSRDPDCVSIGLASAAFPLFGKQAGWDRHSYGYHGDDGSVYHSSGVGSARFGPTFGVGDVVGCGLDYRDGSVFFTKNGRYLGVHPSSRSASLDDSNGLIGGWYGVVGLDSSSVVRVSVAGPWLFDVVSYERQTSQRLRRVPVGQAQVVDVLSVSASQPTTELKWLWRTETRKRLAA